MDSPLSPLVLLGTLFALLLLRIPIAFAMILTGLAYFAATDGWPQALSVLSTTPYATVASYLLSVIPMFVFIGELADRAGYMEKIYKAVLLWTGHLRGSTIGATIIGAAVFGACSGSSLASAAALSRIAYPQMVVNGVSKGLSAATIAASGTFAVLIPPSITLVVYGFLADASVGRLLIAGIVPGVLSALIYYWMIFLRVLRDPDLARRSQLPAAWNQRLVALGSLWPVLLISVSILGSMYGGLATATESAAFGAATLLVVSLLKRDLHLRSAAAAALGAAKVTSGILLLMVGGTFLSKVAVASGTAALLQDLVVTAELTIPAFLASVFLVAFMLGMFLDSLSIQIIMVPILVPTLDAMGIDRIWFGILVAKMIEIGLISPPFGMNVFVVRTAIPEVPLGHLFRHTGWFLAMDVVTFIILAFFPSISLFLPERMMR